MKPPEIVNDTQAVLDERLAKAKPTFSCEQYLLLERVFGTFVYVMLSLQNAKTSIKRFQRMLFGSRTEHKRNVLERAAVADDSTGRTPAGQGPGGRGWGCRCPSRALLVTAATRRRPT